MREGVVACWIKQGLPGAVADEMFRRTLDTIFQDEALTRWVHISNYQIVAHRVGGQYYFRRDDFTRLLNLIVPNSELADLAASGEEFVWED